MKKIKTLLTLIIFTFLLLPITNVLAQEYEAQILVNGNGGVIGEYNYETVEQAFADLPAKEIENSGKGNVYLVIKLLKDVEVSTTLTAKTTKLNAQIEMNGKSIVSSADPVLELKIPISGITNANGEACSITQKNVTTVSTTTPNTILSIPTGGMSALINAKNVTFGDGTGTAVNSTVMLPMSISDGIYLGKMILAKPMFGAAITNGFFDQDPTPHIDTNAYAAIKGDDNLYYIDTYMAATVNTETQAIIKKYGTIQEAINAKKDGEEIQILKQSYPRKTVLIDKNQEILMDVHGFQVLGAASPNSALKVDGFALIRNKGILNLTSRTKATGMNFLYDDKYPDEFFSTIHNQGTMNISNMLINVNYNHPNYEGNITTITNDSSESDAIVNIDAVSKIGGINIEPEDPATGKYPALYLKGNGYKYKNIVDVEYYGKDKNDETDNDHIIFMVENTNINDIDEDETIDANGNFVTKMYLSNGTDLQKKNIYVKKDDKHIEFEYDSETDTLTIPAKHFTDGSDTIIIGYQYEVTYVLDGKVLSQIFIEAGKDSTNPTIPEKEGYKAEWDNDGKYVTSNRTIIAEYVSLSTEEEKEDVKNPETSDNYLLWFTLIIISDLALIGLTKYKRIMNARN